MSDLIGKTIERYKVVNQLGRGGMATVYRAVDTLLDRSVAIKIIHPEQKNINKLMKRFIREAKTLAKLSQANIVKVLDYGEFEGSPFLIMEYISGGTLKEKVGTPWNYSDAARVLAPVARALSYAHNKKIIHRDVKPANILINESGQPMLSDFGILKLLEEDETRGLTGTGKPVGTPAYMSPEQTRGSDIDGRSDIYSLGIVFFEMLTGKKPYVAGSPIEIAMKHINDPLPKAKQFVRDIPSEAEKILFKCMAKKPADRYQSMDELALDLESLYKNSLDSSQQGFNNGSGGKEKNGQQSRNKLLWMGIPLVMAVGFGVYSLLPIQQSPIGNVDLNDLTNTETSHTAVPAVAFPVFTATVVPTNPNTLVPTSAAIATEETPSLGFPDGKQLISSSNVANIIELNRLEKTSVITLEWTDDGKRIVNAGSKALSIIDPETMAVTSKIDLSELPISMALSHLNDRVFVLHTTKIRVYDLLSAKFIDEFPISNGALSIDVSQDGSLLAIGFINNKAQILNAETGAVIRILKSNYGGWSVVFSPNNRLVAVGTSQGGLMWETATGSWQPLAGGQNNIMKSITFSNDGTLLAGGSKGMIIVWNVESGTSQVQIDGLFGEINSLDFSPDDKIIVAGADDNSIFLWNVNTGEKLGELKGNSSSVYRAVFSPNGRFIVSGANEGTIRIWGVP